MKKIISLLALIAICLVGCSDGNESKYPDSVPNPPTYEMVIRP